MIVGLVVLLLICALAVFLTIRRSEIINIGDSVKYSVTVPGGAMYTLQGTVCLLSFDNGKQTATIALDRVETQSVKLLPLPGMPVPAPIRVVYTSDDSFPGAAPGMFKAMFGYCDNGVFNKGTDSSYNPLLCEGIAVKDLKK